jgi:hypothetical protein
VCVGISHELSLWLLCNVHFVQSRQRTSLQKKNHSWPNGTGHCSSEEYRCTHVDACVCGNNLNIVSMCAVSPVVHTSNTSSWGEKTFQFSCGCEQFHCLYSFYEYYYHNIFLINVYMVLFLFNNVTDVFLLLWLCILIYVYVWLPWLRFFRAFSSVVRQMPG